MNEPTHRTYRTKTGRTLTDADIKALAEEAESGYDVSGLQRRRGRPRIGSAPAAVVPVRLHADLLAAVKELAVAEATSLSELVRDAVHSYLSTDPAGIDVRTSTGHLLTETDIEALADEAERGYDAPALARRPRRRRGARAEVVPVRMPPELKTTVERRAETEATSVSEVIREALRDRLDGGRTDPAAGSSAGRSACVGPDEGKTSVADQRLVGGRYLLVGEAVARSMADVYKAYDTRGELGEVAAKLLPPGADEYRRRQFTRERQILERLEHPNVVSLLDGGVDSKTDRPYLIFPWLERRLQDEMAAAGAMGWDGWWQSYGKAILRALEAAHQLEIQHRDLKPANVLVDKDGRPRIIDFGIAKVYRQLAPESTVNGGSSPFTPRELVEDSPAMTRDTHAWAALAVFGISGVDPYPAGPIDPWERLESARQAALPDIPLPLRSIIDRCLARDGSMRPQSAVVLASQIEAALERQRRDELAAATATGPTVPVILKDSLSADLEDELDLYSADVADLIRSELEDPTYVVPSPGAGRYLLVSATMSIRVGLHPDGTSLVATSAGCPPTSVLDRDRERGWPCTMRFGIGAPNDVAAAADAVREFVQGFEEHRLRQQATSSETRARPFVVWRALLALLRAYEADNEDPIAYRAVRRLGRGRIGFELEQRADPRWVGDTRVAIADGGRDFVGTVTQAKRDTVVLDPDPSSADIPLSSGALRRDRRAGQTAIERQQKALDAVEYGRAARPDLADLLVDPGSVNSPVLQNDVDFRLPIDEPKQRAIGAALGSTDFLIVRGPPGTGKTTFITELVLQEFERAPESRILLASQSHAALDHALTGIAEEEGGIQLVRIARETDERVAESSRPLLLDRRIAAWRAQAMKAGQAWLRRWAKGAGIDAEAVETATRLGTLAVDLRRSAALEARREALEGEIDQLRSQSSNRAQGATTSQVFRERLDELGELREEQAICGDEIKEHIARLVELGYLKRRTPRGSLSADKLEAEGSARLPDDARATAGCKRILALLNDWHARFGLGPAFRAAALGRAHVVAATCVGLAGQKGAESVDFDLIIVDEASKATAPELLIPLARGRRFVLVGDDRQLPPYVEEEALDESQLAERGLMPEEIKKSLFTALAEAVPRENVVTLTHQHRMHPAIGHLVSECFYDGQLTSEPRPALTWLSLLAPRPVTWLTTSSSRQRFERRVGSSWRNDLEIQVIVTFLNTANTLAGAAKARPRVAVLTGYAAQRDALERRLGRERHAWRNLDVECHTVDSFQGRQAEIVLYSVTRANPRRALGFVKERPRVNVALSRAQDSLVIVGDHAFARHARGSQAIRRVLEHIDANPDECTLVKARQS